MYKNLSLLIVSTLISFGALEIALRMIMPERLAFVPTLKNNELTYVPNQSQRTRHFEWDHEVHINADGFRNDKTLTEIPTGTTLVLGDSFTEGYGVPLDKAYPKQLEQLFKTGDPSAHVYNAGHYDTGLPTYRRVYQKIFKDVPEIGNVIIGLCLGNDVLRTSSPPDGRLQTGNEFGNSRAYKIKVFLASTIATYAVLNYIVKTNPKLFDLCTALGACHRPHPPNIYAANVIELAVPHTLNFITEFVREIRADKREAIVLIIPTREQVNDKIWAKALLEFGGDANKHRFTMNTRLTKELKAAGINVLDFTDIAVTHSRTTGQRVYYEYDSHWNPTGHALAAIQLEMFSRRLPSRF